jgi:carboxyl-terminal processing protease
MPAARLAVVNRRNIGILLAGVLAAAGLGVVETAPQAVDFASDFHYAWREIGSTYAYFDRKGTRWNEIPKLYAADLGRVRTRAEFIELMERVVDELYDPHAQLTVNSGSSFRLVPSGTDLWAEWHDRGAVITQVRSGSDAERAGMRPGAIVSGINGVPIAEAVEKRMGRSYPHSTEAARNWALRSVLAGRHGTIRTLAIHEGDVLRTSVDLPGPDQFVARSAEPVTRSEPQPGIGSIRFNDSLGDERTVAAFDAALAALRDARAVVLDLRDTPSGGNSSVARGILGRFVAREMPYQKHVLPSEERISGIRRSWLELVSPRGPFPYEGSVTVLVDHWTGSMGEGLAIGFDGTGCGTVVGTPMAGLLGATYHVTLPATGIGINVPAERLLHVDGTPREDFRPKVLVEGAGMLAHADPILAEALRLLAPKSPR